MMEFWNVDGIPTAVENIVYLSIHLGSSSIRLDIPYNKETEIITI